MYSHAILVLALISLVKALEVFGTNDALSRQVNQLFLQQGEMSNSVEPLTKGGGKGRNQVELATWRIEGNIRSLNPATIDTLTKDDIALVNCDSSPSTDNVSPSAMVQTFSEKKPQAIILYSFEFARCDIKDVGAFERYYTIQNFKPEMLATLTAMNTKGIIRAENTSPATGVPPQHNDQRTPAVAMSILYAVTGIITVLFLVIIATGAWRAHTNPERYGPRTGFAGRPRQSRAKGLARAMLETLPIVKFGDPTPTKGENGDVELQRTTEEGPHLSHPDNSVERQLKPEVQSSATSEGHHDDSNKDIPDESVTRRESQFQAQGSNVGCSICTEDFKKGEDVRVLPCNHQYHPNCIDPWLLNVSGTCPLCRVDLRPVPEVDSTASTAAEAPSASTAISEANRTHHSRVQRILAMRHASVHERIATLRQLATEAGREQEHDPNSPPSVEEERQRRRIAERLRSALRVRTRRASTSGVSQPAQETTSAQTENSRMTGGSDGGARM